MLHQPSAQHRAGRSRDGCEAGPDSDGSSALFTRKGSAEEREAARYEKCATNALQAAGKDHLSNVGRQPAPCRRERKQGNARYEGLAPAVQVTKRTSREEQR